jgi:leucyl-tRNA synthetase
MPVDESALQRSDVLIVIQVNGKVRDKLEVAKDMDNDSLEALALSREAVQKFLVDKQVRKVIVVPGRLVNIVAA